MRKAMSHNTVRTLRRKLRRVCAISALSVAGLLTAPAFAQDRADIDRTQIIGNRELPKVLYIVPWKKPIAGDLAGRPLVSVIDEALAPLDKDVFRRELKYDAALRTRLASNASRLTTDAAKGAVKVPDATPSAQSTSDALRATPRPP